MVYKYQRKTNQGNWDVKDMENAIREATAGSMNAVASKYGIPYATLYRHIRKGSAEKKLGRFKPVFSPEQEKSLLEYIKTFDEMFYGLTREDLKTIAFDFAEKNNIPHPFKNGKAGDEWLMGFKNWHPTLTLRTPEPTSIARGTWFNKVQVDRFYVCFGKQSQSTTLMLLVCIIWMRWEFSHLQRDHQKYSLLLVKGR